MRARSFNTAIYARRPGLVHNSDIRSAWLLLGDAPAAILVAMTDYGFAIGPRAGRKSRTVVLAGHFTREISFDDFADAVNEAAHEAVYVAGRAA